MNKTQMHEFNEDFISRYAKRLSLGEDLRMVWEREFTATETGIKFFELDKEYVSDDGKEKIKYLGMLDEAYSLIEYHGEQVEVEMFHNNRSEYIVLHWGRQTVEFHADGIPYNPEIDK